MSDNNTASSSDTKQIRSLPNISNGKKRISKHTIVQSKTSRRKISNNINEKMFQLKLNAYENKQRKLLMNFTELNQIYHKCTKLSKTVSLPKNKCLEDIENVVARIVAEMYSIRRSDHAFSGTRRKEPEQQDREDDVKCTAPFGLDDLRVWDRHSRHGEVLDAIAGKLLDVYARFWTRIESGVARNNRVPPSRSTAEELPVKRDLVEIVVAVRDALLENHHHHQREDHGAPKTLQKLTAAGSGIQSRRNRPASKAEGILTQAEDQSFPVDGRQPVVMRRESTRELRKRLALVTDRLKAADKDKRDLMVAVRRSPMDPMTVSLQAMLDKEKEKNFNLQSIVDKLFAATKTAPFIICKNPNDCQYN